MCICVVDIVVGIVDGVVVGNVVVVLWWLLHVMLCDDCCYGW